MFLPLATTLPSLKFVRAPLYEPSYVFPRPRLFPFEGGFTFVQFADCQVLIFFGFLLISFSTPPAGQLGFENDNASWECVFATIYLLP